MKRNFLKMSLAAALTLTGVAAIAPQKMVAAATQKAPIKLIKIDCLPGKSVKIWTNYEGGQLLAFRAKNKTKWNVAEIAVDRKDRLWYKIGDNEWIQARYTIDLSEQVPVKNKLLKSKKTKKGRPRRPAANAKVPPETVSKAPTASKNKLSFRKKNKRSSKQKLSAAGPVILDNVSKRAQAVVNLAKSQVGKGYAWGAAGPDNFDCSGLVQYVYNQAGGVKMPRVTTDQVKVGTTVTLDQLQPGDLLYWGSADAPYHVGIYIGNNQYVNAATPDQGVVQQTISTYFYPCVAKRVLQ